MIVTRRTVLAGALAGTLGTALAGCGRSRGSSSGPIEVAYLAGDRVTLFARQMTEGYIFGCGQVEGVSPKVVAPQALDTVQQLELFKGLVKERPAGICLSVFVSEGFAEPLRQAAGNGTRTLMVDSEPLPGSPTRFSVSNDNTALGSQLADLVADALPSGAVGPVVLGTPRAGVPQLDQRALGFIDRLRARRPMVHVIGPMDTADRPDAAASAWRRLAATNPHALAFASVGADGATLAATRQSLHTTWVAASFDIDEASLRAAQRGELLLISPEHFLKGAVAAKIMADRARADQKLPTGWLMIPGVAVTARNAAEILAREASAASRQASLAHQVTALAERADATVRPLPTA